MRWLGWWTFINLMVSVSIFVNINRWLPRSMICGLFLFLNSKQDCLYSQSYRMNVMRLLKLLYYCRQSRVLIFEVRICGINFWILLSVLWVRLPNLITLQNHLRRDLSPNSANPCSEYRGNSVTSRWRTFECWQ